MIECAFFYELLQREGVGFFTGVPDSLLKELCAFVTDHAAAREHVIAANEGGAVALAAGYHLATGGLSLVYMQNSGQGHAMNPLLSLCDPAVYGIPMLLLVGWRGEPDRPDEPQHAAQGRVTQELFAAAGIPCSILPDEADGAAETVEAASAQALAECRPVALLVRKGTFAPYARGNRPEGPYRLSREEAIEAVTARLPADAAVVATTGMAARELFEYRERTGAGHQTDFLCIGGMGHASQIALGIALARPEREVFCLDGDGAALMHLGGVPMIGSCKAANYKHILLNNGVHDSVGAQPTAGFLVDFCAVAAAAGYEQAVRVETRSRLDEVLEGFISGPGPALLEIRLAPGARKDLGRPDIAPKQSKHELMDFLNE